MNRIFGSFTKHEIFRCLCTCGFTIYDLQEGRRVKFSEVLKVTVDLENYGLFTRVLTVQLRNLEIVVLSPDQ